MAFGQWRLEKFTWHTNRFLVMIEPGHHFATIHVWNHDTGAFECCYINFRLPFQRGDCTIDSIDLELDLVIEPDLSWEWKDLDDYRRGIERDILRPEWVRGVEQAKMEIVARVEKRLYPLEGCAQGSSSRCDSANPVAF